MVAIPHRQAPVLAAALNDRSGMPASLKIVKILLLVASLPGIALTLFAAAMTLRLVWREIFPDPADIGHGMAMAHALVPMVAWMLLGLLYLSLLGLLWWLAKRFLVGRVAD